MTILGLSQSKSVYITALTHHVLMLRFCRSRVRHEHKTSNSSAPVRICRDPGVKAVSLHRSSDVRGLLGWVPWRCKLARQGKRPCSAQGQHGPTFTPHDAKQAFTTRQLPAWCRRIQKKGFFERQRANAIEFEQQATQCDSASST